MTPTMQESLAARDEVPESMVQETLDTLCNDEIAEFADALGTARAVFRDYPELVTAEKFPEEILLSITRPNHIMGAQYLDMAGCLDFVEGYQGEPFVTQEMKDRLMPEAVGIATYHWNEKRG